MVNFANLASMAERLVRENGRDVSFLKTSTTAADLAKPWRGPAVTTTGSATVISTLIVRAAVVPIDQEEVDGQLVERDDVRMIVAADAVDAAGLAIGLAVPVALENFDRVSDSDLGELKIVNIQTIKPADRRVAYLVQLRQ